MAKKLTKKQKAAEKKKQAAVALAKKNADKAAKAAAAQKKIADAAAKVVADKAAKVAAAEKKIADATAKKVADAEKVLAAAGKMKLAAPAVTQEPAPVHRSDSAPGNITKVATVAVQPLQPAGDKQEPLTTFTPITTDTHRAG